MNIIIYDTEHFETTYALIQILDTPQNRLAIFTTSNMHSTLTEMLAEKDNGYSWFICKKSNLQFIFQLYKYCKKKQVSYLFLNTVSYHHIYFGILCFFLRETKSVLTVHDANNFFNPKFKFEFRSLMHFFGKKILKRTVSMYATLLKSTQQYIYQTFETKRNIIILPGAIYEKARSHKENNSASNLSLAVCGSIDRYRRDYEQVLELANELERKQITSRIILLGSAVGKYGQDIIRKCMAAKLQFVQFIVYTSNFVNASEYQMQLQQCDFIFQPSKKISQKPGEQPEEYAVTTCSGAFFDAVRFAKPILLPNNITIPTELKGQCIPYQSISELAEYLKKLSITEKKELLHLTETNALTFKVEIVREKLFFLFKL